MHFGRRTFFSALPLAAGRTTRRMPSNSLKDHLRSTLDELELFDTHEHIISEAARVGQTADFFTLASQYTMNVLVSAGLPEESLKIVNDPAQGFDKRWEAFAPFWRYARFTGYAQALRIAIRDIYGVDQISRSTLPQINRAIAEMNRPGLYRHVLKRMARIQMCVLDDYWNAAPVKADPEFFLLARNIFDRFVTPSGRADIAFLERLAGVSITSLRDLKRAAETSFRANLDVGMVAVKSTLAYDRDLFFSEVEEADAGADFERMMQGDVEIPAGFRRRTDRPFRKLEDHMFHYVISLAREHHVIVQIHTGLQSGNGNFISNSDPTKLTNLFFLYPSVKFDLFHIGYPYVSELATVAKMFPNVYVDFCWAYVISPTVSQRTLHEYLETIPVNKIMGFGGDYRYPELSYAHAKMARGSIASVLAEKTTEGFCTEDEAIEIGTMLLRANGAALYAGNRRAGATTDGGG